MIPNPRLQGLYGEYADAVELIVRAIDGHHMDRGTQEREESAYAIARALDAAGMRSWFTKVGADALYLKAHDHEHLTASREAALRSAVGKIAPISGRGKY